MAQKDAVAEAVFTETWNANWARQINANKAYRQAARKWEWPLILSMDPDPEAGVEAQRTVYLDLYHGKCRGFRTPGKHDFGAAPYVIRGSFGNWKRVIDGGLDPLMALATGKLRLDKGSLFSLTRYAKAAKQLVVSARNVAHNSRPSKKDEMENPSPMKETVVGSKSGHTFFTTSSRGIRHELLPMRLYHKAKKLGTWDPVDIDFSRDREEWERLSQLEKDVILRLTSLFQAGEEAVARDIVPLIAAISREHRLEEELYLSTFLFEEAKHTEFFRRFFDEVIPNTAGLTVYHSPSYRTIFYDELPDAMDALQHDQSPEAQLRAAVTYNMIVEGTLAETGYHAYFEVLERNKILPGLRHGIGLLKRDESRHVAYGLYLICRIISEHPASWPVVEDRMQKLLEPALEIINEIFEPYDEMPFGLKIEDFMEYALSQFNKRLAKLESARHQPLDQIFSDESAQDELR